MRRQNQTNSIVFPALAAIAAIGALGGTSSVQAECQSWAAMGKGANNDVLAVTTYNGQLIAGGEFSVADGQAVNHIARWDGSTWQPINGGVAAGENAASVQDMTVYNGKLIVAGQFDEAGGQSANHIASWNGETWQPLGEGLSGNAVFAVEVYDGQLYAAGDFTSSGGQEVKFLARWNGSGWEPLDDGPIGVVWDLQPFNGHLFACGWFTDAIAAWNGSSWVNTVPAASQFAHAMTVFNGQLIVGGAFGLEALAGGWQSLGNVNGEVYAMTVHENELIVAGSFSGIDGQSLSNIARWNGESWSPVSGGTNGVTYSVGIHNGQLIAGGDFSFAGGQSTEAIARLVNAATIAQHPQDVVIAEGAAAVLSVTVQNPGSGDYGYEWRKGGELLINGGNISGATTDTLTINNISESDLGAYDVRVISQCGSVLSNPAAVSITSEPSTCPADVAPTGGDGAVDVTDLLEVLSAWGSCP